MCSTQQHWDNISRYENLKNQIRRIVSELSLAAGRTGSLDSDIRRYYQVNDNSAAMAESVASLRNDIQDTANYLNNSVISDINSSIANERQEIQRIEEEERRRQEEEERRRQEEEDRRRREEEANT